jgi:predicted RNA polymerase sigma factor
MTAPAGVRNNPGLLLEHLFRRQAGRMVAHFTRLLGPANLELAEEAVQDALLRALETWPYSGIPENAPAWLFRVAHNAAIDALRRGRRSLSLDTDESAPLPAGLPAPETSPLIPTWKSNSATMNCG